MKKIFIWFRKIAMAEGISFIVLLFIAMPLKYWADMPMAVRIVGSLHGILFVAFMVLAWEAKGEYKKGWAWFGKALLASLLPFGTFVMDKQWRREEAAAATKPMEF
jgi:integral membrane protein